MKTDFKKKKGKKEIISLKKFICFFKFCKGLFMMMLKMKHGSQTQKLVLEQKIYLGSLQAFLGWGGS